MGICQAKRAPKDPYGALDPDGLAAAEGESKGEPVYLNVYDLMIMNHTTSRVGLGIYHTGVEVYGREYSFAGHYYTESTGLRESQPHDTSWLHDAIFKERVLVGHTTYTQPQVRALFTELKPDYLGPSYNVLDRNCNHFTQRFLRLLTQKDLPDYVNRVMNIAAKVRPCLPTAFKQNLRDQTPPADYGTPRPAATNTAAATAAAKGDATAAAAATAATTRGASSGAKAAVEAAA